jgi:CXXX repeat modification system protein
MDKFGVYQLSEDEMKQYQKNIAKKVELVEVIRSLDNEYNEQIYEGLINLLGEAESFKRSWWNRIARKYHIENIPGYNLYLDPEKQEIKFKRSN